MNNSTISVMFEEIKGLLLSLHKRLDEKVTVKENLSPPQHITEPKPETRTDTIKPEQLIRIIAVHLQDSERKIGQVSGTIRETERHVLSQIEEFKRIVASQKPESSIRHYHVVDLKSSKVVVTIVALSVLFLASLFGNIHQFEVNSRMTDNDLKYRYIKSVHGISSENLEKLEDIFHYHRNEKIIKEIHQEVADYERKIKKTAEEEESKNRRNLFPNIVP